MAIVLVTFGGGGDKGAEAGIRFRGGLRFWRNLNFWHGVESAKCADN
jgi:hypothetical protein